MSYYDRIAERWEGITGHNGGALKRLILNDLLLARLEHASGLSALELGAGNGYLMHLAHRRGVRPARLVITDISETLLEIARARHRVEGTEYLTPDVRREFPFGPETFDIVVAVMLFNELGNAALGNATRESYRVLRPGGRLIGAAVHPAFVASLSRRGELHRGALTTMPGAKGLRLPVVERSVEEYRPCLQDAGYKLSFANVTASPELLRQKPGLRHAGRAPVALFFEAEK